MCIIIDTCAFSSVFNRKSADHTAFRPVLKWIAIGNGRIVYGGNKYKNELKEAVKYHRIIGQFKRAGRVIEIDSALVDEIQNEIENMYSHPDFDDPHLVAIVIVSRVKLVCTNEQRACPFLKHVGQFCKLSAEPIL